MRGEVWVLSVKPAIVQICMAWFVGSTQNRVRGVKRSSDHERHHLQSPPKSSGWRKPTSVVLKEGTERVLVGVTLDGEAAAQPWDSAARQQFGSAGASRFRGGSTPGTRICGCAQDSALTPLLGSEQNDVYGVIVQLLIRSAIRGWVLRR